MITLWTHRRIGYKLESARRPDRAISQRDVWHGALRHGRCVLIDSSVLAPFRQVIKETSQPASQCFWIMVWPKTTYFPPLNRSGSKDFPNPSGQ